jgi:hypothetical protein
VRLVGPSREREDGPLECSVQWAVFWGPSFKKDLQCLHCFLFFFF